MGHLRPAALAEMRGVKAEGGWAVVCSEEVEFHWASDLAPFAEGSLIDDDDLPMHDRHLEGAAVDLDGGVEVLDGDADVIDAPEHCGRGY